jgi:DeoR/GlpR family transcriptional regulator of sugar metabolism
MISSCAAVIGDASFERSLDQKEIKRAAFMRCKQKILLIDHTKFSAHGTYRLASLSDYDLVVTDTAPPKDSDLKGVKLIY